MATIGDDPDEMGDALKAVDLGLGETAVQVSAGSQHTCAVLGSGGVKCWGRGFYGNLGLESFRARCACLLCMRAVGSVFGRLIAVSMVRSVRFCLVRGLVAVSKRRC